MDTLVAVRARRHGIGTRLIQVCIEEARRAGCEWLHADFDEELQSFYFGACGFVPTPAGLIEL
jgi:GNAT superfamily N-acetyltransferase